MLVLKKIKKKIFPRGIKKDLKNRYNRVFKRTTEKDLIKGFTNLEIPDNAIICIHCMLSGFGYITGGPETIIHALQKAVPNCTIFMPTFSYSGTMIDYARSTPPPFKVNRTPSKSGLLTETLRLMDGAKRSCHPTNSCVALGPKSEELILNAEFSQTPFGPDSSYGRFCNTKNAYLLLLHTNNASIVHCIQEMVDLPNLFYPELFVFKGFNSSNELVDYKVNVHIPKIPSSWILHENKNDSVEYIECVDYCLLFPRYNEIRILKQLNCDKYKKELVDRHNYFRSNGIYSHTTINDAEILSVNVEPWLKKICEDLGKSVKNNSMLYSYEKMKKARDLGLLERYK